MTDHKKLMYSESRVDVDVCTKNIGNRFELVHVAALRVRELRRGAARKVSDYNSAAVTALKEIEAGHVKRDYLKRIKTDDNKGLRSKNRENFKNY